MAKKFGIVAIVSVWCSAMWIEYQLKQLYDVADLVICHEQNWTTQEDGWAAETSPDGTAEIIESFPDPQKKIRFRRMGWTPHGCYAARAELAAQIPPCEWVWVADVDEFHLTGKSDGYALNQVRNIVDWKLGHFTTASQDVRSFYWDFTLHTWERFTRFYKWYPDINPWFAHYDKPLDNDMTDYSSLDDPDCSIFHYSYVPTPGVRIKGAQSTDTTESRYVQWYKDTFSKFNGENLEEVYASNSGGVHVFGGLEVSRYSGPHPEVLSPHPLRNARWTGESYVNPDGSVVELSGWWNKQ